MSKNSFDGKKFMKELLSNDFVGELSGELLSNEFVGSIIGSITEAVSSGTNKNNAVKNKLAEKPVQKKEKSNKQKKQEEVKKPLSNVMKETKKEVHVKNPKNIADSFLPQNITEQKLREAVIWSEVLGEPVCRRRRNRR